MPCSIKRITPTAKLVIPTARLPQRELGLPEEMTNIPLFRKRIHRPLLPLSRPLPRRLRPHLLKRLPQILSVVWKFPRSRNLRERVVGRSGIESSSPDRRGRPFHGSDLCPSKEKHYTAAFELQNQRLWNLYGHQPRCISRGERTWLSSHKSSRCCLSW